MAFLCYKNALDTEKRDICLSVFYEFSLADGKVAQIKAKEGFDALFKRHSVKGGGPSVLFSELVTLYLRVKLSMDRFKNVSVIKQQGLEGSVIGSVMSRLAHLTQKHSGCFVLVPCEPTASVPQDSPDRVSLSLDSQTSVVDTLYS